MKVPDNTYISKDVKIVNTNISERRNIFEILESRPILEEIKVLENLITSDMYAYAPNNRNPLFNTIEEVANYEFKAWKGRNTAISCEDLKKTLGITTFKDKSEITLFETIQYLEYVNSVLLVFDKNTSSIFHGHSQAIISKQNLFKVIDRVNLMFVERKSEQYILVPKNPNVISVAESMDEDLGNKILEYHHHLLKGDVPKKRSILQAMSLKFESSKTRLNDKGFFDDNAKRKKGILDLLKGEIGFFLNKYYIRHADPENQSNIAKISSEKLEELYDDLYKMLLVWFQEINYINNLKPKLDDFKKNTNDCDKK